MDDSWQLRLAPKFRQVVENLRPLSVLDHLLEKDLIDTEEYKGLRSPWYRTDEDRSRMLLTEILPKKGPQSFQRFCEVLLAIRDQAHIATDILGYELPVSRPSVEPSPMSDEKTASNSDRELFELAEEVGVLWEEVAMECDLQLDDIDVIEKETADPKKQALKMLRLLRAKMPDFSCNEVRARTRKIKRKQYDAQLKCLIFPENIDDDKKLRGREEELDAISKQFWDGHDKEEEIPKFCLQVVSGLGGIGKSSVALKYASEWKEWYGSGVLHFNAESYSTLHTSVRQNMHRLSLRYTEGSLMEDNQTLLQCVYSKRKMLLLYDGADDLDLLQKYLPRSTASVHVLVTTRTSGNHALLTRADKVTSLTRLKTGSAVKALQAWSGRPDEVLDGEEAKYAACLVSEDPVDGLPLPIAHAGTYIQKSEVTYFQYYRLLKTKQEKLEALVLDMQKLLQYFQISSLCETLSKKGIRHPNDLSECPVEELDSVAVELKDRQLLHLARKFIVNRDPVHLTWQLDIVKVKETDNDAMELLLFASFLASKNIPERLLRPLVFSDDSSHHYSKSLSTLKSHTLIDMSVSNEGYHIDLHPLVQSTIFERLLFEPEELRQRLTKLCQCLLSLMPSRDNDIRQSLKSDSFLSLIPHLYATAEKVVRSRLTDASGSLLYLACRVALILQQVDVAVKMCHEHMKLFCASEDPRRRFEASYLMGKAHDLSSHPQTAEIHFRNALSVIDGCSGDDKRRLSFQYKLGLDGLAKCCMNQEMFNEAEGFYWKALELWKERPEENKQQIAAVLNNLALSYHNSGQIQKAIEAYEEVLEIMTGDKATPVLNLANSLGNMGGCLMENSQFEKALPLLERSLSINRENLPGNHLDLANALRLLSSCCRSLGDVQRAIRLSKEASHIASNRLPSNHSHPHMALYLGELALCQVSAGRLDEAIHLSQQSLGILRQNLPSTRRQLCTTLSNLGLCYCMKGMLEDAIKTLEECLATRRSFLPGNHPDIGTTLWNLGIAYKKSENVVKATEILRECLSVREKSLRATHPHLIDVSRELGFILFGQEQYEEALQMYGKEHDILAKVSPNSEAMAHVYRNMGSCYMMLSRLDAAEETFSQALTIYTDLFPQGNDHISRTERELHKVQQWKLGH